MTIEDVIDRAVQFNQSVEIQYCTRNGKVFSCEISKIVYSPYYGGAYIQAYCSDWGVDRTFKVSRILKVNGHSFSRIFGTKLVMTSKRFIRRVNFDSISAQYENFCVYLPQ